MKTRTHFLFTLPLIWACAAPAADLTLKATPADNQITLTWADVPGTTTYSLCSAQQPITDISQCTAYPGGRWQNLTGLSHTIPDLVNTRWYYFRLMAQSPSKILAISNPVKTTPKAPFVVSRDDQEVKDLKTGLIWRRCAEGMTYDSEKKTCLGEHTVFETTEAARQYAFDESARTLTVWRVPTGYELQTILYGKMGAAPYINPRAFPGTPATRFLGATEDDVDFKANARLLLDRSPGALRLVRGDTPARFVVSTDGQTVEDRATGLNWQRCAVGQRYDRGQKTCRGSHETYTFDQARGLGTGDWRVPTIEELQTILDPAQPVAPYINPQAFPATPSTGFWSSSGSTNSAWVVGFDFGFVNDFDLSLYGTGAVRLVRGG